MMLHLNFVNFFLTDPNAGRHGIIEKLVASAMVDGFFAGCTTLEALLPSTLNCLYDIQCLLLLPDYFPNLNQVCSIVDYRFLHIHFFV